MSPEKVVAKEKQLNYRSHFTTKLSRCTIAPAIYSQEIVMFLAIDNWLFDKVFQPFADWFTDRTGRNVHWLAATCAYLYGACIIVKQLYLPSDTWLGIAFDVLILLIVLSMAKGHDRQSTNHTSVHLNPYRTSPFLQFMRILGTPMIVLSLSDYFRNDLESQEDLLRIFQNFVFLSFLYFEACETKPPAPPKKKEAPKLAKATL